MNLFGWHLSGEKSKLYLIYNIFFAKIYIYICICIYIYFSFVYLYMYNISHLYIYIYILFIYIYMHMYIDRFFAAFPAAGRFGKVWTDFPIVFCLILWVLMRSQGVYAACVEHVSLKPVGFSHISVDMTWKFLEL